MASFANYSAARSALPADAVWSCSFGYPGDGGFFEYFRDARGDRFIIANGAYGDEWSMRPESLYGQHLPIFVAFYDPPTEERLERVVSRLMDHADKALLSDKCTQAQYDAWVKALDNWSRSVKTEA